MLTDWTDQVGDDGRLGQDASVARVVVGLWSSMASLSALTADFPFDMADFVV